METQPYGEIHGALAYVGVCGGALRSLWRAKGNVALVDLSHAYFVIRFHQEEDMMDEGLKPGAEYLGKET